MLLIFPLPNWLCWSMLWFALWQPIKHIKKYAAACLFIKTIIRYRGNYTVSTFKSTNLFYFKWVNLCFLLCLKFSTWVTAVCKMQISNLGEIYLNNLQWEILKALSFWATCPYMLSVSLIRCKNEALKKNCTSKAPLSASKKVKICKWPEIPYSFLSIDGCAKINGLPDRLFSGDIQS